MSPQEKKYSATEGECATLMWGVTKVRPFIIGAKFYVHTDHQALLWLFSMKAHNAKLCRWASILSQYDYNILYKVGRNYRNADFMSRSLEMYEEQEE